MVRRLRGHHLLCTALFQGKGYSDGFCAGMERITSELRRNPSGRVQLVAQSDGICAGCPKLTPELRCSSDDNQVVQMDTAVIRALQLEAERDYSYGELLERAEKRMTPALFLEVCGDCSWHRQGLCSYEALKERLHILRCVEEKEASKTKKKAPEQDTEQKQNGK